MIYLSETNISSSPLSQDKEHSPSIHHHQDLYLQAKTPSHPFKLLAHHTMHSLTFFLFLLLQSCTIVLPASTFPVPPELARREFHSAYQALYDAVSDEDILGKANKVNSDLPLTPDLLEEEELTDLGTSNE